MRATNGEVVENDRDGDPRTPDTSLTMADRRIDSDELLPVHELKL